MTGSPQLALLALNEVCKLLGKLTEEQLIALTKGEAVVEFKMMDDIVTSRPVKKVGTRSSAAPGAKTSIDLDEVVREIKEISHEDEVERYLLEHDKQLTLPLMRELAERIGPPVSSKGDKKTLRKNIAAGTAGLLHRSASAFSGSWNR